MAQTQVSIASPYEVDWVQSSGPLAANTVVVGPVTRSCKVGTVYIYWGSNTANSGSVTLVHDPSTGPAGTGSAIAGSALMVNTSAGAAAAWVVTGSTQLVPGDFVTLQVVGSTGGLLQARLAVQLIPN